MPNKIIDSHVHFWDPELLDYPWLEDVPPINRSFLPADYSQAIGNFPVAGQVFVQACGNPNQAMAEVEWVSTLAKTGASVKGIIAFAPLELGERAAGALEGLTRFPLVKGIRRLIQSEPLGFSTQPEFVRGVQLLADFNFSFDICIKHHQLQDVLQLVEQCPDVQFVLDHIGKPDIAVGLIDPWKEQITQLATYENVTCKLSGLVTEADIEAWQPADLTPYISHILETFGPNRTMFGSDWPVCTLATTYQKWLEITLEATSRFSPVEQDQIFYQNAVDFYKL